MAFRKHTECIVVAALLAIAAAVLSLTPTTLQGGKAGVSMNLPNTVSGWRGSEIMYCDNPDCRACLQVSSYEPGMHLLCPRCGNPLGSMSYGERLLLPPDTTIRRKRYVSADGRYVTVQIALSGVQQKSIHRPQQCLEGQGNKILRTYDRAFDIPGRPPLNVTVLDLQNVRETPDGRTVDTLSAYAYWFVGYGKETHSHLTRLFWMARDRLLRNTVDRWAYISLHTARSPDSDDHLALIAQFLPAIYPSLVRE